MSTNKKIQFKQLDDARNSNSYKKRNYFSLV